jgi:hypothetical protein
MNCEQPMTFLCSHLHLPWHLVHGIHCPNTFSSQGPRGLLHELLHYRALFHAAISHISHACSLWYSQRDTAEFMVCRWAWAVTHYHTSIFSVRNHHHWWQYCGQMMLCCRITSARCQKLIHLPFTGIMHSSIACDNCFPWCVYWCVQQNSEINLPQDAVDGCCCHLLDIYSLNWIYCLVTRCYFVAVVPFISEQPFV